MRNVRTLAVIASLVALTASACGGSSSGGGTSSSKISGTITVFAAASLTAAFTELGHDFEQAHPGTHVRFSFGGSDALAAQITNGAPADVFASASPTTMALVTDKQLAAGTTPTFARNQLQIAVQPGNPLKLNSLSDIVRHGVKLAMCAPTVPCGTAALTALKTANLTAHPVTQEVDVKSVLTKVELGEVDAGLVYKTDVQAAAGKVDGIAFPEAGGAINSYPIARLKDAPNPTGAQAFIDLVLSATGRSVLAQAGFLSATP